MSLNQLKTLYEKRRSNLVSLLEKNQRLDAARQHQIYGAICEIDILLKTIDHLREQDVRESFEMEIKSRGMNPNRV